MLARAIKLVISLGKLIIMRNEPTAVYLDDALLEAPRRPFFTTFFSTLKYAFRSRFSRVKPFYNGLFKLISYLRGSLDYSLLAPLMRLLCQGLLSLAQKGNKTSLPPFSGFGLGESTRAQHSSSFSLKNISMRRDL